MRLWLRPCRLSFALCTAIAFFQHPDEASHITIGEPPRYVERKLLYAS